MPVMGLRGDDTMGNNRADLFSVGVTFDLPLFTENRQDQLVKAEVFKTEASENRKATAAQAVGLEAFYAGKAKLMRLEAEKPLVPGRIAAANSYSGRSQPDRLHQ